ncbi:hypothetical protein [Gordonia alkaliphila]|uniref:hypothetical protein n=1 Tax=Gordonia alkaliphila TaxID=1053547 RepID=UPI0031EB9D9B
MPIKAIVRRTGVATSTGAGGIAVAGATDVPAAVEGSSVGAVEPQIRQQWKLDTRMPATVIAERIGWTNSLTIRKKRIRLIRPEYVGIDAADRIVRTPGESARLDVWFPATRIPTGHGQTAILPVLVITLTFSKFLAAMMIPSRQAGDILAGMWELIAGIGTVSSTLVWDRESPSGGRRRLTDPRRSLALWVRGPCWRRRGCSPLRATS